MTRQRSGLGFRGKFILVYLVLVTLLMYSIGSFYYNTTWQKIYSIAKDDLLTLTWKDNQTLDQKLRLAGEYANGLMVDADIQSELDEYASAVTPYQVFALDRPISAILNKYFLYFEDVLSVNIMTKRLPYGQINTTNIIPADTFAQSSVCRRAIEANGRTVWVPTYHFFDEYRQAYLHLDSDAYQYVFSAAKLIRLFPDGDYAVLVINFPDNVYADVFGSDDSGLASRFLILSREGTVIANSDRSLLSKTLEEDWVPSLAQEGSGVKLVRMDGAEYIMAFQTSAVTGWISCIMIDRGELMREPLKSIVNNLLVILMILLVVMLLILSFLTSGLFKPLDALRKGMHVSGHGQFDVEVPETGIAEVRHLTRRFNKMNQQIETLIRENYQMVILQKEQELNVYNLQLDPHFILNSLSLLNLELLRNGQDELSTMTSDLSAIMNYLLNTHEILVPFRLDWEHTRNYLHIMSRRYRDRFRYETDIDPDVMDVMIPKLLLQPLVENSIMHGLRELSVEGRIWVRASLEDGRLALRVEDNGKGFTARQIEELTTQEPLGHGEHEGGLKNVRFRLYYLYGRDCDVTITSTPWVSTVVTVRLPVRRQADAAPIPGEAGDGTSGPPTDKDTPAE